jgi:hypothetical protein
LCVRSPGALRGDDLSVIAAWSNRSRGARHPEIGRAAQPISAAFLSPAAELVGGDQAAAGRLVSAIVATAHGHAMLMLDGTFGSGQQAADAAARAATATLALVTGREVLR